ncbi:sprT-like domain-containing protein Spartan [Sipha flava]|uniref:Protein with SprT-like domain at the N terminus n=1 Tax=Sipha flava TaxID=143950 RepID=A0A8B8FGL6_9HEMI|nr:sprT-like domain-containing protein Spartan [Sipha flava]
MDASNDYLFALQLQNDLVDLTDIGDNEHVDITKFSPGVNAAVNLENHEIDVKKQKRSCTDISSQPIKRPCNKLVKTTEDIVDISWETLDPNPDIHSLFLAFNKQYFWGTLETVVIQWSKRMTVCAGLCRYQRGFCSISLSEPLLKLRPRKDLVETLLHEMIHAYLFLTNNKDHRDRDGHGPEFCKHMYRINVVAGTKISIYHDFHDEVRLYKQHWWKCNGPCQYSRPFYGFVKRSMNRAPGPSDRWWANHQAICSGSFIKIKEPEGYGLKKKSTVPPVSKQSAVKYVNKITNFIKILDSPEKKISEDKAKLYSKSIESNQQKVQLNSNLETIKLTVDSPLKNISENITNQDLCLVNDETTLCPVCNDSVLTDWLNIHLQNCSQLNEMFGSEIVDTCRCPACNEKVSRTLMNEHLDNCKILNNVFENVSVSSLDNSDYVNCPICDKKVKEMNINTHLDVCIPEESSNTDVKNLIKCPCCENIFSSIIELDDHIDNCLL